MIAIGIKNDATNTINWYRAHSMNRHPKGHMVAFGNDPKTRTPYSIPLRNFAGIVGADFNHISGDIEEWSQ